MGKILTDSLRQPVFVIQLYIIENIEREMFDQSVYLVKHQFHHHPLSKLCTIWYLISPKNVTRTRNSTQNKLNFNSCICYYL